MRSKRVRHDLVTNTFTLLFCIGIQTVNKVVIILVVQQKDLAMHVVAQMVKNLPVDVGDLGLIPGLGRSPGEGNGNPLQYSCQANPMDRGA